MKAISSGVFSPGEPGRYRELIDGLYNTDWFMVAADFDAYADAQRFVDKLWTDEAMWRKKAIHNVARMAWFSSDRTIKQYAKDIWNVPV